MTYIKDVETARNYEESEDETLNRGGDTLLKKYESASISLTRNHFYAYDPSAHPARQLHYLLTHAPREIINLEKFPDQTFLSVIETYSTLKNDLEAVVFRDPPNSGSGFKEEDVVKMRSISKKVPFIWHNEEWEEYMLFHKDFFMTAETIPHFDYAMENKKTVSLFGSARYYDPNIHYQRISNALDSVKKVLGDDCFIFHGGGPAGMMPAFSEIAKSKGIRVGSSSILLNVEKEFRTEPAQKIDAIITYDNSEIFERQKTLLNAASAATIAFNPGGIGTVFEIVNVLNNNSLYGSGTTAIVVGDENDCISGVIDVLEAGKREGTINQNLRLYRSEDGNLDDLLRRNDYLP